tara:strand:- start:1493 stop:2383 length:891 start_codon:yes stop_codon:yes gene_type:complete
MAKVNIHIFGSTTTSGLALKELFKNSFKNYNLIFHSRRSKDQFVIDLNDISNIDKIFLENENIIISLAPIWLFSKFLKALESKNKKIINNISQIIAVSSSSLITKKYAFSDYDKSLVKRLEKAELELLKLHGRNKFTIDIIRPTMIYGNIKDTKDKNINVILSILRKMPFILLPTNTGERQPIHAKQLAYLIFYRLNLFVNRKINKHSHNLINVGGDVTINYYSMIKNLQKSLPKKDIGRFCLIIQVPKNIFFFCLSFLLIIKPKLYESILRISTNLSGFQEVHKLTLSEKSDFPI